MTNFLDRAHLALDELAHCSRCGRCQAVCPVYLATRDERLVARGKLALIDAASKGALSEPTPAFIDTISRCLLCGACRDFCARGVATDTLIQQVRAAAAVSLGLPRLYQLLFAGLKHPRLLSAASRAGSALGSLAAALPGAPDAALLPWVGKWAGVLNPVARPYLAGPLPEAKADRQASGAVGLFVGCGANYLYPEAARAAVRLLEASGLRVVVPPAQVCCGLPAWGAGDTASAAELEGRNLAAFAGCERIVALCASCAHRLRGYQRSGDAGLGEVLLLPELLAGAGASGVGPGRVLRVAYHTPCHVRFEGGGGAAAVKGLLAALPGVELLAVDEGCCGSGGLFGLAHPDLSRAILEERLCSLLAGRPDVIATDCSGCLIQLRAGLRRRRFAIPVLHPALILAGEPLTQAK